jgi:nucleotide-binding universal stress UspA family protein
MNEEPQGAMLRAMRKILVGFDDSDESRDALAFAERLARLEDAALQVAVAGLFEPQVTTHAEEASAQRGRRAVFAAVTEQLGEDRRFEPTVIEGLPAARGLIVKAQEDEADLIVVGSTHRGRIGQVFPGSVGAQLLHGATCPVAIVPRGFRGNDREVRGVGGVAYDGSPEAGLALGEAVKLARRLQVKLSVIVVDTGDDSAATTLERGLAAVSDEVEAHGTVLTGDPTEVLIEAGDDLDFLALGSRGRGPLARTLLGSVAAHVCCGASCPVVVSPRPSVPGIEEARAAIVGSDD